MLVTLAVTVVGALVALGVANAWLGAVLKPMPELAEEQTELSSEATLAVAAVVETAAVEPSPTMPASIVSTLVVPAEKSEPKPAPSAPRVVDTLQGTVVIEAGHQKQGDPSLEPVGPGASERKAKVTGGARGVATRNPEGEITLAVAKKLRTELEGHGVKVIMVRTKQDVNIANSKRAKIANDANADVFIRLHCDGSSTSSTYGLSTLIPGKNQWTGPIMAESKKAGRLVHDAVIASTGANDRGMKSRTDLSGFNWSKVPTVLVEMGFMSNPAEDRKLATEAYQKKLAAGMASGIVKYLESK
jgi:N-acetylmuramoyl-L-alanine amidase